MSRRIKLGCPCQRPLKKPGWEKMTVAHSREEEKEMEQTGKFQRELKVQPIDLSNGLDVG